MAESSAELIIEGRIATFRGGRGYGWVDAIAIGGGRVIAAGTIADVRPRATGRTSRWRLPAERVVMPALTDAHLHLEAAAIATAQPDLTGLAEGTVSRTIAAAHTAMLGRGDADGWLLGHGWSLEALGAHPDAALLDAAAPGRPVALWAHDHHARWINTAAMREAGLVDRGDPPAGRIERDPDGRPTGVLYEMAAGLVDAVIPEPDDAAVEAAIGTYAAGLAALGVTSVHDPGALAPDPGLRGGPVRYRAMAEAGRMRLRVTSSVREEQLERAIDIGFRSGRTVGEPGSARYRDGWLKLFADGALGSRTAALLAAYETDPDAGPPPGGALGMPLRTAEQLSRIAARAAAAGIASQVHAIGDAAARTVLDVMVGLPTVAGASHRVEHAQLVDPADLPRFGALGVAASVQPGHLASDAGAMRRAWGDRCATAFALASMDAAGTVMPFGTDAPVEPPDPWPGIAVAVTRRWPRSPSGEAFCPEQSIALHRALRAACRDGPHSAGIDDLGHLDVGACADLIVVPAHTLDPPSDPDVLGTVRPIATMLGGAVIHAAGDFDP